MIVLELKPGSYADLNGMKLLDVVIAIDGEPVNHMLDVSNILMGRHYEPGRVVELLIIRDQHIRKLEYTLGTIDLNHLEFYDESSRKPGSAVPIPPDTQEEELPPTVPPHAEE